MQADVTNDLLTDNPLDDRPARSRPGQPGGSRQHQGLSLGALLVKTDNPATLEKVRTMLTLFNASVMG